MTLPRVTLLAPRVSLIAWVAATLLLVVLFRAAGWQRVAELAARVDGLWIVAAVLANLAIQPCAAIQWRLLLPAGQRLRLRTMLSITALSSLAMNSAPALVGHASSVVLLARQPGICHSTALSVLALDQLTEGLAKVTVVLLAIAVLPVPDWMRDAAIGLAVIVALFLAALLLAARSHLRLARWPQTSKARSPLAFVARWAERLETLRTPRRFVGALLACYGMKLAEAFGILATQQALGIDLPVASALLVLAAAGFGTMVPLAPGNLGTYEAAVFVAYRWLGVPAADALALAVVQHLAYLVAATGAGYALLSVRQLGVWRGSGPARVEGRPVAADER